VGRGVGLGNAPFSGLTGGYAPDIVDFLLLYEYELSDLKDFMFSKARAWRKLYSCGRNILASPDLKVYHCDGDILSLSPGEVVSIIIDGNTNSSCPAC
jgi:hypothetical protein